MTVSKKFQLPTPSFNIGDEGGALWKRRHKVAMRLRVPMSVIKQMPILKWRSPHPSLNVTTLTFILYLVCAIGVAAVL